MIDHRGVHQSDWQKIVSVTGNIPDLAFQREYQEMSLKVISSEEKFEKDLLICCISYMSSTC